MRNFEASFKNEIMRALHRTYVRLYLRPDKFEIGQYHLYTKYKHFEIVF